MSEHEYVMCEVFLLAEVGMNRMVFHAWNERDISPFCMYRGGSHHSIAFT